MLTYDNMGTLYNYVLLKPASNVVISFFRAVNRNSKCW